LGVEVGLAADVVLLHVLLGGAEVLELRPDDGHDPLERPLEDRAVLLY
jgi:hypothetical protein